MPWHKEEPPQDISEILNADYVDLDLVREWAEAHRNDLGDEAYTMIRDICDQREQEWDQQRANMNEMLRRITQK